MFAIVPQKGTALLRTVKPKNVNFYRYRIGSYNKDVYARLYRPVTVTPKNTVENYITSEDITKAILEAQEGVRSGDEKDAIAKWDIVHELWLYYLKQEEKSRVTKDSLDDYCSLDPDAQECREFDL